MKPFVVAGVLALAAPGWAEDSLSAMGGYYYEYQAQNNRVEMKSIEIKKDLPAESDLSAYFLVDQITSASSAFQGGADQLYRESRKEEGFTLHKRFGAITPGVGVRRSDEPDYESTAGTFDTSIALGQDSTVIRILGQFQDDNVKKREVPSFHEDLNAIMGGVHVVQALRPDLQVGGGLELSQLDGFQSNPYRRCASGSLEAHPDRRQRVVAVGWGAWRAPPTRTTLYAGYRFYDDNWAVRAHTGELRITQPVLGLLELEATWRPYRQTAVYFVTERLGQRYCTGDPKLSAFDSRFVEGVLRVGIPPFWFLRDPRLEAAMGQLTQGNRYGDAVLARLGGSFAF